MCGIVGYVGSDDACSFLIDGLRRLGVPGLRQLGRRHSWRNIVFASPDRSAGSTHWPGNWATTRQRDRLGIGHTRWATHGPATEDNAHPHFGGDGEVVLVHNGVIENFQVLKDELIGKGYKFKSETDSEVIAHLIAEGLKKTAEVDGQPNVRYLTAVQWAVARLRGTYGLAIAFRDHPNLMIAARFGSPLVIGVGKGEYFVSSDASPLAGRTDRIVYLADHQIAVLTPEGFSVLHRDQGKVRVDIRPLEADSGEVSLEGYDHYMLKEIYEQPESIRNAMRGRLDEQDATAVFGGLNLTPQQLAQRRADHPDRLRHELAFRVGRRILDRRTGADSGQRRIRQRASLSQPADRKQHAGIRDHAEWRDGRYARGAPRDQTQRPSDVGDLQRRGQLDRAGGRRRRLLARRTRKSASPAPRPTRRSAACWRCWHCTSAACVTSASSGARDHRGTAATAQLPCSRL